MKQLVRTCTAVAKESDEILDIRKILNRGYLYQTESQPAWLVKSVSTVYYTNLVAKFIVMVGVFSV